jgi:hypothetical protein
MRSAAEGAAGAGAVPAALGIAALALVAGALFFSDGSTQGPLVALGVAALGAAALGAAAVGLRLAPAPRLGLPAVGYLGCLAGLVLWAALTIVWSQEPAASWRFSNRVLAYLGFACVGVLAGGLVRRAPRVVAGSLAALLGGVFVWALAAKAVPSLYPDYERLARLRSPVGYWNALAVLGDVAVALGLWLASARDGHRWARVGGAGLLYLAGIGVLLTYSRFGIALAALVAAAWVVLAPDRIESLAAVGIAGGVALGVFAYALSLPGITDDGVTHAQRAHDGWRFGLVLLIGALVVLAIAAALVRVRVSAGFRRTVDRVALWAGAAAAVAVVALLVVFSGRVWHSFTNASDSIGQSPGRLASASSSNRWTWWQEAWNAFLRHPGGGTGGGTFDLTNQLHRASRFDIATEPHSTPLQFLSETGIVGFLLWAGVFVSVGVGVVRGRRLGNGAVTALGLGVGAWALHMLVDIDWSYVAVSGPMLLVGGVLVAEEGWEPPVRRRPLLAATGIVVALGAAYSLAAPWYAQRELNRSETIAITDLPGALSAIRNAHRYDPLSVDVLQTWAALEDAAGRPGRALYNYRAAVRREPLNPDTWYELGLFWLQPSHHSWYRAYRALDRSWGLDRHGPAGIRCGPLDRARRVVKGYGPKCP